MRVATTADERAGTKKETVRLSFFFVISSFMFYRGTIVGADVHDEIRRRWGHGVNRCQCVADWFHFVRL